MSAMRKVSMRGLAAHKVRFSLTVLSVLLGTAFIAASFIFTQMLGRSFDDIIEVSTAGVAVEVTPKESVALEGPNRQLLSGGVPLDLVPTIQAVDGVRIAEAQIGGSVTLVGADGEAVGSGGAPSQGFAYTEGEEAVVDTGRVVEGRQPARDGEVVVNVSAAEKAGLEVGDRTQVILLSSGPVDVELVGLFDTDVAGLGGYIGVGFTPQQATELLTDGVHASSVYVAAEDGVGEDVLTDRVAAVLPEGLSARPGSELVEESRTEFQSALTFINAFLTAFGFIALLVGSFIIANTFSMVVAQRSREMALLRAIGASRGQITRSVAVEALVVGLVGSALGLLAGLGLAWALTRLLSALGTGIPVTGQTLSVTAVVVTLVVGVGVTMLAALTPARRAGRVAPVEAMRGEFATPSSDHTLRLVASLFILLTGVVATVTGATSGSEIWLGIGFLGVGATVVLMSPLLAPAVFTVIGPVLARPFGAIGRMARGNASRNPRRTAATALALALGLALVSAFAVIGASAKASLTELATAGMRWDHIVAGPQGQLIPADATQAVQDVPGVDLVVTMTLVPALLQGEGRHGIALTGGDLDRVVSLQMTSGEQRLTDSTMLATQDAADENGWEVGDLVTLTTPDQKTVDLTVAGTYDNEFFAPWIVGDRALETLTTPEQRLSAAMFVVGDPGVDQAQLEDDVEEAVAPFKVITVDDREAFSASLSAQVDILLGILYGLIALAVLISILGIVNTLGLSVVERRREIGMLRAVGMMRSQVRQAIYVESVLISVYGAVLGLLVGVLFGWLFTKSLADDGLAIAVIPWGQALLFLVVAAVVGVLAALWPAHRAAQTRPLEAIAAE